MKVYLDVCCLNRPYDDQTEDRIRLESEAVIAILKHIELKEWYWVSSGIVNYEIDKTTDEERKSRLKSMARWATEVVSVDQYAHARANEIQRQLGIKAYDSLHIACAEIGKAEIFLSTDDKLIRASKRNRDTLQVEVENPLIWLQKEMKE